jgi:hypothetical protein
VNGRKLGVNIFTEFIIQQESRAMPGFFLLFASLGAFARGFAILTAIIHTA